MSDIRESLKSLPDSPGVYMHKDKLGQVIYVGKAKSLKNRVSQYFQSSKNMDAKVRAMVSHIDEFEYINCQTEMEALILENNLIKKYMPKYNVLLRDDKTYPYLKITNEEYPRLLKTRIVEKDGAKYYGPYTDVSAVNQMMDLLNSTYSLKRCSVRTFPGGHRPCLNYHINQCDGVCMKKISRSAYNEKIKSIDEFLKGKQKSIVEFLKEKMEEASKDLRFEEAARYRDYISAAKSLSEKQRVVLSDDKDLDIVLGGSGEQISVFYVRDGKLSGRERFEIQASLNERADQVVAAFIKQHYGSLTRGPREILVSRELEDAGVIEEYLFTIWGRKVSIAVPKRGEKKAILDLAKRDVAETSKNIEDRKKRKAKRDDSIGREISRVISKSQGVTDHYKGQQYRLEAYDISNTSGADTVGAMVVFDGLNPNKKAYRKFKVKTTGDSDDYGSMKEVLFRRLKRGLDGDKGFLPMADLILMDGGKGHVSAAKDVLNALNLQIPVVGMAKDDSHRTTSLVFGVNQGFEEESLKENTLLFQYLGRIQEEVHRFVIEYHRGIRDGKHIKSVLEEIEGIGEKKRNALLLTIGSLSKIKEASKEELMKVPTISEKNAENIIAYFIEKNND
ncbi:MAG: excinuclease ABC subunit UvrC [Anaerovoracaceae bacterium]